MAMNSFPSCRLIVLLWTLCSMSGLAASDTARSEPAPGVSITDTVWSDIKGVVNDGALLLTAPLRFDGGDWMLAGGLVGATGGAMLIDDDVRTLFARGHDSTRDAIARVGNEGGTFLPAAI